MVFKVIASVLIPVFVFLQAQGCVLHLKDHHVLEV